MLVKSYLGFRFSVTVFVGVVVIVGLAVVFVRRKWRHLVVRSEEVNRLLVSASRESARFEFETYYYNNSSTAIHSPRVEVEVEVEAPVEAPVYNSSPLSSAVKPQYKCVVCLCSTTTRCAKCKAIRYCSGKCQILHWRQGHKDECRPYVAVSPINDVEGSSYEQEELNYNSDGFNSEVKQSATLFGPSSENSPHKDDVGIESPAHQQGSDPLSESYKGFSGFSTTDAFSADVTIENLKKSAGLGDSSHKIFNLSDEETQSGTSSSSLWTDDGSNESSLPEPLKDSSGFWDETVSNKKSNILKHDDLVLGDVGEAAN